MTMGLGAHLAAAGARVGTDLILDDVMRGAFNVPGEMTPWYGDILSAVTPDFLYQYDWESPQALQGQMAQAAGIQGVGTGAFGQWGTSGATRDKYVTTVQRIKPTGAVETVSVNKGKPLITRQDIAQVKRVKNTLKRLKRCFPGVRYVKATSRRRRSTARASASVK